MIKSKLIVNADDFGQSTGINSGIIQAHEKGIVTSASLMVRYNAAIGAAEYAKNNIALGVGLHIDLGEWIFENGNWVPLYEVVSLDNNEAVKNEVSNQVEAFFRIMGRKPTHIDSHQHVHQREYIKPILLEIAARLNVTLRGCSQDVLYCGDFYGQGIDGSPLENAISVAGLNKVISKLPEGITELACHPGLDFDLKTMYMVEREKEVATLCDAKVKLAITDSSIELCTFEGIPF